MAETFLTRRHAASLRSHFGRPNWLPPTRFGDDGWALVHAAQPSSIIVTAAVWDDTAWVHASIAAADRDPSYDELQRLHRAVFGDDGYAYQIFVPRDRHVNIHPHALHLWGRLDGRRVTPDFGAEGTI